MVNFYKNNIVNKKGYMTLFLAFLFLGIATTSIGQGTEKRNLLAGKSRKTGSPTTALKKNLPSKLALNRRAGEISKPLNGQKFSWQNNAWQLYDNYVYTYDAAGRVVEEVTVNPSSNESYTRTTYAFDSHGNEIKYVYYFKENNAWVISTGYKTVYTYTNNRLTEEVDQHFSDGVWTMLYRAVYTLNAAGSPTEIVSYQWNNDDRVWDATDRNLLEYASGSTLPTSTIYQEREGNVWVNDERLLNITWYDAANTDLSKWQEWKLGSSTAQMWDAEDQKWINSERMSVIHDANGGVVETEEEWINNAWVNDYRYTRTYDQKGNELLDQSERWKNNQWVINYGHKSAHTYNASGNLTETIGQYFNTDYGSPTAGTYQNNERMVYSNFQIILSAKDEFQKLALRVYPNPAAGHVFVQLEKGAGASVKVLNLTGQTLRRTVLSASNEQEINLSGLPVGTYILQIQSKTGVRTQKIVKL